MQLATEEQLFKNLEKILPAFFWNFQHFCPAFSSDFPISRWRSTNNSKNIINTSLPVLHYISPKLGNYQKCWSHYR